MLLAALQEAQSVVRSYDTKAQIVGVGYILALNLVLHFGDLLPTHAPLGPLFFAVVWGVVIMPILQFGQVLYPVDPAKHKASCFVRHPKIDAAPGCHSAIVFEPLERHPCSPVTAAALRERHVPKASKGHSLIDPVSTNSWSLGPPWQIPRSRIGLLAWLPS